jgi:hypothetical protein
LSSVAIKATREHIHSPDYVGHAGDQIYTRAQDRAAKVPAAARGLLCYNKA